MSIASGFVRCVPLCGLNMLALQLEVSFCSFYFVGAELSDATTGESRETGEPAFVYGIEPCTDWWCTKSHMIVVDEGRDGPDGDAIGPMEGPVVIGVAW